MVTDRRIIVSNGTTSIELTARPFTVNKIEGFDAVDVNLVTSQGFDQDGADDLNAYVQPRAMTIGGSLKAATTVQMQRLRDALHTMFIPKRELTINHYYGGKNRTITAKAKRTPSFEFTDVSTVQNYEIRLQASKPYWRDPSETLIQMANVKGGFHFPLVIPKKTGVVFGLKSSSLIANVYNESSIRVGIRIVFVASGKVVNPQLFNVNTREYIRILCEMGAGEQITIQTGEDKTVTRTDAGATSDYMGHIDLAGGGNTFLELDPGDNLFRYGADEGESFLETRIFFYNRYTGV